MNQEVTGSTEVGTEGAATEKHLANIVRGTIPHPLVYMIRFEEAGLKDAEVAKKYGTTTGKVADIRKGRNFGYIDESYAPTQAAKDAAIAWLKRVPAYDEVGTDSAVTAIDSMKVASEADIAAFQAKRAATRAEKADAPAAASEGGEGKPAKSKAPKGNKKSAEASAEDLMS